MCSLLCWNRDVRSTVCRSVVIIIHGDNQFGQGYDTDQCSYHGWGPRRDVPFPLMMVTVGVVVSHQTPVICDANINITSSFGRWSLTEYDRSNKSGLISSNANHMYVTRGNPLRSPAPNFEILMHNIECNVQMAVTLDLYWGLGLLKLDFLAVSRIRN